MNDTHRRDPDTRFRLGLVVGKFAPLHLGHLHLIDTAAAQCERVLVLSWCQPEPAGCDAFARARWLVACRPEHEMVVLDDASLAARCRALRLPVRALPPDSADDATQQHFLAWLLHEVLKQSPDAMFASEDYLVPCAGVLSGQLGHVVTPVMVDRSRGKVPVSASRIRDDPVRHRRFLPDPVWPDWVPRIVMLGGESSGKSTLAQALADRHGMPCVPEYGRALWEARGGEFAEADLLHIAQEQVAREVAAAARATRFVACDTSPLTTLFYARDLFGRADPELVALADRPYHLQVLCEPDFPFVQDGTRRGEDFRRQQHAWYARELVERGGRVLCVRGSLERRLTQVEAALLPP